MEAVLFTVELYLCLIFHSKDLTNFDEALLYQNDPYDSISLGSWFSTNTSLLSVVGDFNQKVEFKGQDSI